MCIVKNCDREDKVGDLCQFHYQRQRNGKNLDDPIDGKGVCFEERLKRKIDVDGNVGCWIFRGSLTNKGYGKICKDGKKMEAHRASFEFYNKRKIGKGMCVCHKCDTPACVNPEHLFEGTQKDNMQDAYKKGRLINLKQYVTPTKLSKDQINMVRNHIGDLKKLSEDIGISRRYAYKIRKGENLKGD
jgi:hypothetical protein